MKRLTLLAVLLCGLIPLNAAETRGDTPIVIKPGAFLYPRVAANRSIDSGWASVAIEVDETGTLVDQLVTGYSHSIFAEAATTLLRASTFEPATEDGQPIAVRMEVPIEFETSGIRISSDWDAIVDMYLNRTGPREREYRIASMADLDGIPVPEAIKEPVFSHDLARQGIVGVVKIDFYIDDEGKVRMPAIIESDFPVLGQLAIDAVRTWRFQSPHRNGRAVAVRAVQEFRFKASGTLALAATTPAP